jgi:ribonuclease P protein component
MRFPKEARIRRRFEYRSLQREGRRFHAPHFVILYRPGCTARSRVGITVSRRVGNAVIRNRVKRWVREFSRQNMGLWPTVWDYVVIARPSAGRIEHPVVDRELRAFFDHLGTR